MRYRTTAPKSNQAGRRHVGSKGAPTAIGCSVTAAIILTEKAIRFCNAPQQGFPLPHRGKPGRRNYITALMAVAGTKNVSAKASQFRQGRGIIATTRRWSNPHQPYQSPAYQRHDESAYISVSQVKTRFIVAEIEERTNSHASVTKGNSEPRQCA